jgi:enoyl-CoA hydratase/carnithine racemase
MSGLPPTLHINGDGDGHIAHIRLHRPDVANRLSFDDLAVLHAHLQTVNAASQVRVLCLAGDGRHFCSGFDLGSVGSQGADAADAFERLADALETVRPVSVVALQGGAYGGAVDLALACDFRVACPASVCMIPAARIGLHFYRGGLERLVARTGLATARRLLLAADTLDAQALRAAGLVDRWAETPEEVAAEADALAEHLAALAPLALQGMKRHLNRIARGTLDAASAAALAHDIATINRSQDLREGSDALRAKRVPVFQGH